MTLSSREFRKKPLSESQTPEKSCLKSCNKERHGDFDKHSIVSTKTDEETESLSFASSFYMPEIGRRVVTFGTIEVREYPIILGDNPSPTDGVPITIDWEPQRRGIFNSIDMYEQKYHDHFNERRYGKELILDAEDRAQLAVYGGATLVQIGQTALTVHKIQKHRAQSSQKGPLELLWEGLDRTLHPNRPRSWKVNCNRLIMYANAAA